MINNYNYSKGTLCIINILRANEAFIRRMLVLLNIGLVSRKRLLLTVLSLLRIPYVNCFYSGNICGSGVFVTRRAATSLHVVTMCSMGGILGNESVKSGINVFVS